MRRRNPSPQTEAPGQDSFLDIVANLVGILLILIMVVGVRTKDAIVAAQRESSPPLNPVSNQVSPPPAPALDIPPKDAEPLPVDSSDTLQDPLPEEPLPPIDAESAKQETKAVEDSILEVDQKLKRQALEAEYRLRERNRIQVLISTAERKLTDKQKVLSTQQQAEVVRQQAILDAERDLSQLQSQFNALSHSQGAIERLDHLPTPMAKTVFGKEVHFRLSGGKLALVPWDDLVARLKDDAPNKIWKLKDAPRITETIGPLAGFRLRYTLKKSQQMVNTESGPSMQQRASLDFFHLVPVQDDLGEPAQQAMANNTSQLNNVLGSSDPKSTTITVWVYPDSFEAFRDLKQYLFKRGFLTASRPMPQGRYMGGAPEGQRSASQ